jgi:hypothetical protein
MIELYYPCGITAEEYNKWWKNQMQKVNDRLDELDRTSIEELLTTLHNEPELEIINPLSEESLGWGKGIKWQMENTTSYTYTALTKEKFEEILKSIWV